MKTIDKINRIIKSNNGSISFDNITKPTLRGKVINNISNGYAYHSIGKIRLSDIEEYTLISFYYSIERWLKSVNKFA